MSVAVKHDMHAALAYAQPDVQAAGQRIMSRRQHWLLPAPLWLFPADSTTSLFPNATLTGILCSNMVPQNLLMLVMPICR